MAQLEVIIGANIADLQNKLARAIQELDQLKLAQKELTTKFKLGLIAANDYYDAFSKNKIKIQAAAKDINGYQSNLLDLNNKLKQLKTGGDIGANSINKMQGATANAVPTLTSFSQVIQDAPYGIRGVANNITQLTSQFGYLQKSTGGTGAALKAMLGTLAGPAGILLAVSAVTSLLVAYGDKLKFAADSTSELAAATKEFLGDAIAEKTALESLLSIARDETNSKVQRSAAIAEINEKYSKYLGFLDEDSIKTDQVTTSVKLLTLALLQKAKIQGLADVIAEKSKDSAEDLISLDLKRQNSLATVKEELKRLNKENAFFNKVIDETDLGTLEGVNRQLKNVQSSSQGASEGTLSFLFESVKQFKNLSKEIKGVNSDLDDTLLPLVQLQEALKKQVFEIDAKVNIDSNADSVVDLGKISKKTKKTSTRDFDAENKEAEKQRAFLIGLENDVNDYRVQKAQETFDAVDAIVAGSIGKLVDGYNIDPFAGLGPAISNADKAIIDLETKIKSLQSQLTRLGIENVNLDGLNTVQVDALIEKLKSVQNVSQIASNAIGSAFSEMTQSMADAFNTGNEVLDAFIGSVLNTITQMLTQLLAQQIAQAAAQTAISTATQAQKTAAATASIATSSAVSTANAIEGASSSAAATGPGAIFTLGPFIALAVALIAGAFAGIGSFAKGGFTSAEGKRDKTGFRVVGLVHEGEYVVPKKVLQTPAGSQMVDKLENIRTNKSENINSFINSFQQFASGGFTEGKRDSTGFKVAGVVHENEYVVPKRVLQTKAGAQMVNQLEDIRNNKTSNVNNGFTFANGGFTSNNFMSSFATGGFTSIKNISGMVYNIKDISNLSSLANNPISNNLSDGIVGEVVLRGNNQVIQLKRAEKRMNRFYNS